MTDLLANTILPRCHDNGTPVKTLVEARCDAYSAISDALAIFRRKMAPNARDYEPGQYEKADDQYQRRMRQLSRLLEELACEAEAIQQQQR
jgi:hypothetical protein